MAEEVGLETTSICQHMIRSQEKAETATKEKEGVCDLMIVGVEGSR